MDGWLVRLLVSWLVWWLGCCVVRYLGSWVVGLLVCWVVGSKSHPKVLPKGSQTNPNGSPNPLISTKSGFQNAYTTKCAQSHAKEIPQDPLQPQTLCSRLYGSIVFTFPLVAKSDPKLLPRHSFGALWLPKWTKSPKGPFKKTTTNQKSFPD